MATLRYIGSDNFPADGQQLVNCENLRQALCDSPVLPGPPISEPTFVKITSLSRMPGRELSQRPIIVSDSPPEFPRAQVEIDVRRVDGVEAMINKGIKQVESVCSSTFQPGTLAPNTRGRLKGRIGRVRV